MINRVPLARPLESAAVTYSARSLRFLLLLLLAAGSAGALPRAHTALWWRGSVHRASRGTKDPRQSVPAIARILGVRVGLNGQDALQRQFGKGLATVGGHPDGRKTWLTPRPLAYITTDGFSHNAEGLTIESITWGLDPPQDKRIPFVRALPPDAGWLGTVTPGMTRKQVQALTARLPQKPVVKLDRLVWTDRGFIRPSRTNAEVFNKWIVQLVFEGDTLTTIDIECKGGLSAP